MNITIKSPEFNMDNTSQVKHTQQFSNNITYLTLKTPRSAPRLAMNVKPTAKIGYRSNEYYARETE